MTAPNGDPLGPGADDRLKNVGDLAPGFELPDQWGTTISLRTLLGRGELLLYFCDRPDKPECLSELIGLSDSHRKLASVQVQIAAIVQQRPQKLQQLALKHAIAFHLLSGLGAPTANDYGAEQLAERGLVSVLYLIDEAGIIVKREISGPMPQAD